MRLYATITSERATKGQGGNKQITIELKAFDRINPVAKITLFPWKNTLDDKIPHLCIEMVEGLSHSIEWTKAKKQKGECKHFIVRDDYGKEYCQECGTYDNLR